MVYRRAPVTMIVILDTRSRPIAPNPVKLIRAQELLPRFFDCYQHQAHLRYHDPYLCLGRHKSEIRSYFCFLHRGRYVVGTNAECCCCHWCCFDLPSELGQLEGTVMEDD